MNWDNIPQELKGLRQWVCWQAAPIEGKPDKIRKLPINPRTGEAAQSNNPDTWTDFQTAASASSRFSGLGFMFANGYFGVDIDGIDNDIEAFQQGGLQNIVGEFLHSLASYGEYSVSGKGLHIICKGKLPTGGRRRGNVEMYERGRFFVMTGNQAGPYTSLRDCTELVKPLHEKYIGGGRAVLPPREPAALSLSDNELLEKARNSRQGKIFSDLYAGDWEPYYSSQSEADFRLCSLLAFWTGRDEERMDQIFRSSGLMREKWDRKQSGSTYGRLTVAKAAAGCTKVYEERKPEEYGGITFGQPEKRKIYSFDDTGNAERFCDQYGDMVQYSYIDKGWIWFDGRKWLVDDIGMVHRLADKTVEDMSEDFNYYMEHAPANVNLNDWEKSLNKHIKVSRSSKAKNAMLKESEHRQSILPEQLDQYPMLLNTPSGTLDLGSGELLSHSAKQYLTRITASEYTDKMECPLWLDFLKTVFVGDMALIRYLQKAVGYTLTGSTAEQCMFVCYGEGRNGKSTLLDVLYELLGGYAANVQPEVLMANRKNSGGPLSEIARLRGARLVVSAEPEEGMRLNEGLIKQLTGGDRVTARFLYGKDFEFKPEFKLWIAANHKPVIRGTDTGIWRRVHLIPFTVQIPEKQVDRTLPYKLRRELPGILRWAAEGCLMWQKEGLEMPPAVVEATAEYRSEMDILGQFLAECTQQGPMCGEVPAGRLYQVYRQWAQNNGEFVVSGTKFGREMGRRFKKLKKSNMFVYCNLKINENCELQSYVSFS